MEQTLVIIKPDAIQKRLIGRVLSKIEDLGLSVKRIETIRMTPIQCRLLYPATRKKLPGIYAAVEQELTTQDSIALIARGKDAIQRICELRGPTNLTEAPEGTIRRDFVTDEERENFRLGENVRNLMHASASCEEAAQEMKLFFGENN